jgi:hypothetical protein
MPWAKRFQMLTTSLQMRSTEGEVCEPIYSMLSMKERETDKGVCQLNIRGTILACSTFVLCEVNGSYEETVNHHQHEKWSRMPGCILVVGHDWAKVRDP